VRHVRWHFPNSSARPYIGDLGFVGRTLDAYNVYESGDGQGAP